MIIAARTCACHRTSSVSKADALLNGLHALEQEDAARARRKCTTTLYRDGVTTRCAERQGWGGDVVWCLNLLCEACAQLDCCSVLRALTDRPAADVHAGRHSLA